MFFSKEKFLSFIEKGESVQKKILRYLADRCLVNGKVEASKLDQHQLLAYDLAWMESELSAARQMIEYADRIQGEIEEKLAELFLADIWQDLSTRISPYVIELGFTPEFLGQTLWSEAGIELQAKVLNSENYRLIMQMIQEKGGGDYGLTDTQNMTRDMFKRFVEDCVLPSAEKIHRYDLIISEKIIGGLRDLGCFGLSIPSEYGGLQDENNPNNSDMILATEELSRGSLGAAGSLITRPEILAKALLKGGTPEQKRRWLPQIASGHMLCAVAVTEPDFGSDVAGIKLSAVREGRNWILNGAKTWCTFAGYANLLLVLARTDPNPHAGYKGLSLFVIEKTQSDDYAFEFRQHEKGKITGRAISTIGYRGMHSFDLQFENVVVPIENLIGGEAGLGKGFYLQMEGFAGGRLQTAARANGVMQAAFEKALRYSLERNVFGKPIFEYQLPQYKLARMAAIIQACRQLTYHAARLMDKHEGQMEASLVKFYASKMSEWVTREAMQLHGGMGYAEEYAVSRYYLDARVFSIFEGAEEVLATRVIARSLIEDFAKKS